MTISRLNLSLTTGRIRGLMREVQQRLFTEDHRRRTRGRSRRQTYLVGRYPISGTSNKTISIRSDLMSSTTVTLWHTRQLTIQAYSARTWAQIVNEKVVIAPPLARFSSLRCKIFNSSTTRRKYLSVRLTHTFKKVV